MSRVLWFLVVLVFVLMLADSSATTTDTNLAGRPSESFTSAGIVVNCFHKEVLEDHIEIGIWSNWGNATWTLWENESLVAYNENEGMYYHPKNSTPGWYNLTILLNGTDTGGNQAEQTKNFTLSGEWVWVNAQYWIHGPTGELYYIVAFARSYDEAVLFPETTNEDDDGFYLVLFGDGIDPDITNTTIRIYFTDYRDTLPPDYILEGFYYFLYGEHTLLARMPANIFHEMAADSIGELRHITIEWMGVAAENGGYEGAWGGGWFPEWVNNAEYALDLFFNSPQDQFIAPDNAYYLLLENGTKNTDTRLTYDIKAWFNNAQFVFNASTNYQINPYHCSFYAKFNEEYGCQGYGRITWNTTDSSWYMRVDLYNIDTSIWDEEVTVSLEPRWGVAPTLNHTGSEDPEDYRFSFVWVYSIPTIYSPTTDSDWAYIYTYNQAGDYVDWENFVIYINETEIPANHFYNMTAYVYNITLTDIFGDTVYSQVLSFTRTYRLTLNIHSFKLVSELNGKILIRATSSGGGYKETWLYWGEVYEWWLYESKSYQWYWEISEAGLGQPQGPHYYPDDGSWYTPVSAAMFVIDAYGMGDIYHKIPDPSGGGGISQDEADIIAKAMVEDLMSLLNPLEGGPVGVLILVAFVALAYMNYMLPVRIARRTTRREPEIVEEDRRARKPKRKAKEYKSKERSKRRS